jgi:hypothetical protein
MDSGKKAPLGINASEDVKAKEVFGNNTKSFKGIAGTLHITSELQGTEVLRCACDLSRRTKLPVVVVVRVFD